MTGRSRLGQRAAGEQCLVVGVGVERHDRLGHAARDEPALPPDAGHLLIAIRGDADTATGRVARPASVAAREYSVRATRVV